VALAVRAVAALEVEGGDDGADRGDVGLVLDVDRLVLDGAAAVRALVQGDVVGLVDVVGRRPVGGGMAGGPAGLLGLGGALAAAEGGGLAALAALEFVEAAAAVAVLLLQGSQARFEAAQALVALVSAGARQSRSLISHNGGLRGAA